MIGWLDRHVSGCWTSVCLSIGVKIVLFILFLCHASIIFFSIIKIILYKAIIKQRVKFSFLNYEYYFHISLFYYFSLLSNEEERKKDTSNAHLRWAVSNRAFTLLLLDFFFLFLYSLFFFHRIFFLFFFYCLPCLYFIEVRQLEQVVCGMCTG